MTGGEWLRLAVGEVKQSIKSLCLSQFKGGTPGLSGLLNNPLPTITVFPEEALLQSLIVFVQVFEATAGCVYRDVNLKALTLTLALVLM